MITSRFKENKQKKEEQIAGTLFLILGAVGLAILTLLKSYQV